MNKRKKNVLRMFCEVVLMTDSDFEVFYNILQDFADENTNIQDFIKKAKVVHNRNME